MTEWMVGERLRQRVAQPEGPRKARVDVPGIRATAARVGFKRPCSLQPSPFPSRHLLPFSLIVHDNDGEQCVLVRTWPP